jgi:hypothetical protein
MHACQQPTCRVRVEGGGKGDYHYHDGERGLGGGREATSMKRSQYHGNY